MDPCKNRGSFKIMQTLNLIGRDKELFKTNTILNNRLII